LDSFAEKQSILENLARTKNISINLRFNLTDIPKSSKLKPPNTVFFLNSHQRSIIIFSLLGAEGGEHQLDQAAAAGAGHSA
jgi:hypothetical protein